MRVGFDLDEIFVTHPPIIPGWVIERLYRTKVNGYLFYRIPGTFEQKIRKFSHSYLFRPPLSQNINFIKDFAKKNDDIFLITSRFGFLQKETMSILKQYGLQNIFKKIYLNEHNLQPHIFKNEMIKKSKIKKFIDDDMYLLEFLAKKNPETIFFWLNKKENKKITKNLFAITNIQKSIL